MWSFESVFFYSALCFRGGIHVVACIRLRIFLNLCFLVVVRSRRSLWNWEELWRLSSPASPHFRDEIKAFITWNSLLVLNVSHIPSSVSLGGGEPGRRQLCISPWLLFSCELVLSSHPVRLGFGSIHGSCSWIWGHSCLTTVEHAVYKECTRSEVYWSLPLYCIFYLRLLSCFYESFWKQRPLIWWHPANELLLLDTKFWKPDWRLCMLCASAPWCCALKGCFLWPFHLWRTCRGPGTSLLLLNFLGLKIFSFPLAGIYGFVQPFPQGLLIQALWHSGLWSPPEDKPSAATPRGCASLQCLVSIPTVLWACPPFPEVFLACIYFMSFLERLRENNQTQEQWEFWKPELGSVADGRELSFVPAGGEEPLCRSGSLQ